MDHARAGSSIHVPIYIDSSDSSDSSDFSLVDAVSGLTCPTAESAIHGVVNLEAQEYVEGIVNSCSNATATFKTTADNGEHGETVPIQTIQVPTARGLTSNEELVQGASQQLSVGGRGCTNNMLSESPEHAGTRTTGELRRSTRKRNQVFYSEGPSRSAKKPPRTALEKPRKSGEVKNKFKSLRIRASFYPK